MQSQMAAAEQHDEVLFRIIPGLTAKLLVATPSLTSTTQLTPPADSTHRTLCGRLSYAVGCGPMRRQMGRRGLVMPSR